MKMRLLLSLILTMFASPILASEAIWIDVRTATEYAESHHPEATNIPFDVIADNIATLTTDKTQQIYVYCRSGRRSGIAKETLEKLGYTHVKNIGGLQDALNHSLTEATPTAP